MQTNIDADFINKGHLGNISEDGIKVDRESIVIRGISMISELYRNHFATSKLNNDRMISFQFKLQDSVLFRRKLFTTLWSD